MKAIKISIPEPCHENWQAMTPTEQGRFCNACAKEVIDFSKMTDEEVLNFFTKKTSTNVCGNVYPGQLNRTITKPVSVSQKITWYWKYIVAIILLFAKLSVKAQEALIVPTNCEIPIKEKTTANSISKIYKGRVLVNNKKLAGAIIKLKGTNTKVVTDSAGNFSISIPKNIPKIIQIDAPGEKVKEVQLSPADKENNIIEIAELYTLSEVIVKALSGPSCKYKVADYNSIVSIIVCYEPPTTIKINVLDANSKDFISTAQVTIQKNEEEVKKVYTDIKGVAVVEKIYTINQEDSYAIKIIAAGYKNCEVKMTGKEFIDNHTRNIYLNVNSVTFTKTDIIKATPNPISKGSSFNISFQVSQTGSYSMQIIDISGHIIATRNVWIGSKNYTVPMMSSDTWSSGMYLIRLVNSKGEPVAVSNFLIQ